MSSSAAVRYAQQAEKLSLDPLDPNHINTGTAVAADFVTPQDPIVRTADGQRLPTVPLEEAAKLNALKLEAHGERDHDGVPEKDDEPTAEDDFQNEEEVSEKTPSLEGLWGVGDSSLRRTMPPSRTHPLFPPLPLYGPSSIMRNIHCLFFRTSSFFLSLAFLGIIVLGSAFTTIPLIISYIWLRLTFRNPNARRPFFEEEKRRQQLRKKEEKAWKRGKSRSTAAVIRDSEEEGEHEEYIPTEGGPDPLICDAAYYARRVGLDIEEYNVQTEDGFIITLWHVYNPNEYTPKSEAERAEQGPETFTRDGTPPQSNGSQKPRFPILLMHGLLQSAGAYCSNDDSSLAFYLCKAGYDVWLGNNRCGFKPEHTLLTYGDPRMWAWNIRQMGVMDLPALTSRVLSETGFSKLGLIAHSQGTTQTLVALAKEQRPDLGEKITVFCALAPAAYAGPLIGKAYFKFMRVISPSLFRVIFGIHAFIPFMMLMHSTLPGRLYGALGYRVFSFLFNWSDTRWDRGLRNRLFRFAPVYVSSESMRWWLGRECFAKQKCILSTREEWHAEDAEDAMDDYHYHNHPDNDGEEQEISKPSHIKAQAKSRITNAISASHGSSSSSNATAHHERRPKGSTAWYNEKVPPMALWVAGSDDLVDGRRLLRRFQRSRGREPHVRVVHASVIEEYEHLDVIWAMDSIEKVASQVRDVLWKTCDVRDLVRVPRGCEEVGIWTDDRKTDSGEGNTTCGEEGQSSSDD